MKTIALITSTLALIVFFSLSTLAQPTPGGDPTGGTNPPIGAAGAPIDGGISILLLAGAAYGAKKLYNKQKDA